MSDTNKQISEQRPKWHLVIYVLLGILLGVSIGAALSPANHGPDYPDIVLYDPSRMVDLLGEDLQTHPESPLIADPGVPDTLEKILDTIAADDRLVILDATAIVRAPSYTVNITDAVFERIRGVHREED